VPKRLLFCIALAWTCTIAFFCLIQASDIPSVNIPLPNLDKIVHIFFHLVFTILWFLFFLKQFKETNYLKLLIISVLLSVFYGIIIEILQGIVTTTRNADIFDVLANVSGALIALSSFLYFKKFKLNS
jgi:VanZ family protein